MTRLFWLFGLMLALALGAGAPLILIPGFTMPAAAAARIEYA